MADELAPDTDANRLIRKAGAILGFTIRDVSPCFESPGMTARDVFPGFEGTWVQPAGDCAALMRAEVGIDELVRLAGRMDAAFTPGATFLSGALELTPGGIAQPARWRANVSRVRGGNRDERSMSVSALVEIRSVVAVDFSAVAATSPIQSSGPGHAAVEDIARAFARWASAMVRARGVYGSRR